VLMKYEHETQMWLGMKFDRKKDHIQRDLVQSSPCQERQNRDTGVS